MTDSGRKFWVFSNKAAGAYHGNVWDMQTTLETRMYYLRRKEKNCGKVRPGDIGYMREYGKGYLGRFEIAEAWKLDPDATREFNVECGYFVMAKAKDKVIVWPRPLPQSLIIRDLSNGDVRSRLISITEEDARMIETAQRVYERLGFGAADGEIVLLEQGLEDAIKPNLRRLGLHLASNDIQEQFSMGPGVGRSDLIYTDEKGNLVVIELKRGKSSDEVIGQVCRYVGYVRENIAAEGQGVQGWIITGDYDEALRLAASEARVKVLVVRLP